MSLLKNRFRCMTYDLPSGRGDGARLHTYAHADFVADLFSLLDHLSAPQAYLLGTSFGSTITLAAMKEQPDRIPRAILVNGFAQRSLSLAERLLARWACYWPGAIQHLPFREPFEQAPFGPRRVALRELWDFYIANTGMPAICAVARRALIIHGLDLRSMLSEIRQPVLMICGDQDGVVGRTCEDALLHGLPNVARIELSDCGHMAHYSHPQEMAELVGHFLTPPG
jgi:aminoacrylate hydrolase